MSTITLFTVPKAPEWATNKRLAIDTHARHSSCVLID